MIVIQKSSDWKQNPDFFCGVIIAVLIMRMRKKRKNG